MNGSKEVKDMIHLSWSEETRNHGSPRAGYADFYEDVLLQASLTRSEKQQQKKEDQTHAGKPSSSMTANRWDHELSNWKRQFVTDLIARLQKVTRTPELASYT